MLPGRLLPLSILALLLGAVTRPALAERVTAPKLLPKNTVAFVRVANVPELTGKFKETSIGRMAEDPKLKPLIGQVWTAVMTEAGRIEEEVGVSLSQILDVPQGEVALALVAPEDSEPVLVALLDAGRNMDTVRKLLERGTQLAGQRGVDESTEKYEGTTFHAFKFTGRRGRQRTAVWFEKDTTFVLVSDLEIAKQLVDNWEKGSDESLATNKRYSAIMQRCRGSKDETPQITFFVNPIELVTSIGQGNSAVQVGLALLPTLGLDGLHGVGGSIAFATERFDSIIHVHVLLDNPRSGVLELIAFEEGNTTPESWVSDDVARYVTLNWDVEKTYTGLAKLLDSFQGEGATSARMKRDFSDRVNVDFEKEFLPLFAGRFSYATRFERPIQPNSQGHLLAARLSDAKQGQEVLDKLMVQAGDGVEKKTYGGLTYYYVARSLFGNSQRVDPASQPAVAVVDDYLMVTNRGSMIEKAILTKSDPKLSLANALEYKLIASRIDRQAGGKPVMISYDRPEEAFRFVYDLVQSDNARDGLSRGAEDNRFLGNLDKALKENPLPPFSVLSQYLAPGGSMVTDDETGLHYMAFTLKRK